MATTELKNNDAWKKYLPAPNLVYLYNVDRDQDLCGKRHAALLQECVSDNDIYPLYEEVSDWFFGCESYEIDCIRRDMEKDGLPADEFEDHEDEIRDYLFENNNSDPVADLLNNTGPITCFYSLGIQTSDMWNNGLDPWFYGDAKKEAYSIRRALKIKKDDPRAKSIEIIMNNATYGGELRIYFKRDLRDLMSSDEDEDFASIRFKGRFPVAIHNACNGSGDYEKIDLDVTLPFLRPNLFVSESENWNLENVFGLCGDWLKTCDKPTLDHTPVKSKSIKKSLTSDFLKREKELDNIFKSGKCTPGDMKMSRHRNVEYINDFPCGHKCKDCGTFWID